MFDTVLNVFSTIDTSSAGVGGVGKFWGAARVGTRIYFPPALQDSIGVLDTATSVFSHRPISIHTRDDRRAS